jgi:hypothetical protein
MMGITTKDGQCSPYASTLPREQNCKRPLNVKHISEDDLRRNRENMEGING